MEKREIINAIFWILIIAILMACIYLIFLLKAETSQCIENGFLYASKKQISGDVMCSCSVQQPDGSIGLFEFNETEMHIIPTEQPQYAFKP